MGKRPTPSKHAGPKTTVPGSLGEALDHAGFQPLGRRILVGQAVERAKPQPQWVEPMIAFVSSAIPRDPEGNWQHLGISSLELGCEVLVRCGRAAHMLAYGAKPVAEAPSSSLSLRWDDAATVVIAVAAQMGLLRFLAFPGSRNGPADILSPNIRAANGCAPANLDAVAFPVFRSLGLVADESWTEAAETVLWRKFPQGWPLDFTLDRRFLRALELAVASVPADVATAIDRAVTITDGDIDNWLGMRETHRNRLWTRNDALRALQGVAQIDLADIFVGRWRLSDGWLSVDEAKRGLSIKLDPLAVHMCIAFAAMYLPHLSFLFDLRGSR